MLVLRIPPEGVNTPRVFGAAAKPQRQLPPEASDTMRFKYELFLNTYYK